MPICLILLVLLPCFVRCHTLNEQTNKDSTFKITSFTKNLSDLNGTGISKAENFCVNPTSEKSDTEELVSGSNTDMDERGTRTPRVEYLKAYNLSLPLIKGFVVNIGHPKGFNVTFMDDFGKFVVMEFYGCLNEKDTKDKSKIMYDLCIIVPQKTNNNYSVRWVYYNDEIQLKADDEIFFRVCIIEPFGYLSTINKGYFKVL